MTIRDLMNYAHQMETEYDVNIYDLPLQFYDKERGRFLEAKDWIMVDGKYLVLSEKEYHTDYLESLRKDFLLSLEEETK